MKFVVLATAALVVVSSAWARAENAAPRSATSSGDAAVSPAAANPANAGSTVNRPSPGGGVASGALNNGTTGDTIGTGAGTSTSPPAAAGTSSGTK